ncbi:MAG: hypothetical protein ACERLM_00935, partial [Acidimicrobiales bacterium]
MPDGTAVLFLPAQTSARICSTIATTQTGSQTEQEHIMLIQEAIIESPEAQQAPEIPSPSTDGQKDPEARGRYGWVALLAVVAIAVG